MQEIRNIWSEDTDENIVKTWLLGCTEGQTYSINEHFLPRVKTELLYGNFDCIEEEWDGIIGQCDYMKIDDPLLETRAKEIVKGLNALIGRINAEPEKYFK